MSESSHQVHGNLSAPVQGSGDGVPACPSVPDVPHLPAFDLAELDDTPDLQRFEPRHRPARVKLERRGVTQQPELWEQQLLWLESVTIKLNEAGRPDLAKPLADCHTRKIIRECTGCAAQTAFYNRCETFYCPKCTPRLARERRAQVEWWTKQIPQPKHVVLTVRNVTLVTAQYVRWFKSCFARLRRSKLARNWRGGFYSIECTNEGNGWHLHLHLLVDSHWVDSGELARQWARIVGQDFAIVKVKDCRNRSYLAEVTKYAVKGNQLASWMPAEIVAYVDAFKGSRTFGVFGTLYKLRAQWREFLDQLQDIPVACECGCTAFRVMDEQQWQWREARFSLGLPPPTSQEPPKPPLHHPEFAF